MSSSSVSSSDASPKKSSAGIWLSALDEYGRTYYYNSVTKESSWDLPSNLVPPPLQCSKSVPVDLSRESSLDMSESFSETNQLAPPKFNSSDLPSSKYLFARMKSNPESVISSDIIPEGDNERRRSALRKRPLLVDKNPIEGLIDFANLPIKINQDNAFVYRTLAAKRDLRKHHPSAMYFTYPRYFANFPIPQSKITPIRVILPRGANKALNSTKIAVSADDTAYNALCMALKKCVDLSFPVEECVFKVVGREEYLYGGDAKVLEFEYIQYQIRHKLEIRLHLKYVPDFQQAVQDIEDEIEEDLRIPLYPEEYLNATIPEMDLDESVFETDSFPFENVPYIPASKVDLPLRIKLLGIDGLQLFPRFNSSISNVYMKFQILNGISQLQNTEHISKKASVSSGDPRFHESMCFLNLTINRIPWASKCAFLVYGTSSESNKEILLGYVIVQLFDHRNTLLHGKKYFKLWTVPDEKSVLDELHFLTHGTTKPNQSKEKAPILNLYFDDYAFLIIKQPDFTIKKDSISKITDTAFDSRSRSALSSVETKDILSPLSEEEKDVLWKARRLYMDKPNFLPKFLTCVDWSDPLIANEARVLTVDWARFEKPVDALQLLDARYTDPFIRKYAIDYLSLFSDAELNEFLLELVQCLKYEAQDFSPLANFLMERAVANPYQIGHFFFWHLKAELHDPEWSERFALIIEEYLVRSRRHARELHTQNIMVLKFLEIADLITKYKNVEKRDKAYCLAALREELQQLNKTFPSNFQIPLNPRWQADGLIVEECKFMSSKKLPLWLVFKNSDEAGDKMLAIFKSGDDLRQDMLTLQFINLMDRIWMNEGLDTRMKPYTCVATGVNAENEGAGMVEIVVKSKTISRIQIEEGGGASGALRLNPLDDYIKKLNQGQEYQIAVDNFIRSCAGYCVATFVLGVGDRHNDNIMMTESGHLFHIDFGHFLGNFKSKLGFKRERSKLVFTPEMAHVMGGVKSEQYRSFESLCCNAFNVLRRNSTMLMNLFLLMLSAGMPELTAEEDIYYLRDRLMLKETPQEAAKIFSKELTSSHADFYRRVDNTIHNLKHS